MGFCALESIIPYSFFEFVMEREVLVVATGLKSGSHMFANEHSEELCRFLYRMQLKQLHGKLATTKEKDGSVTSVGREGIWRYSDYRQGKQPFSGTITIWMDGEICFTLLYRGRVKPYAKDKTAVEDCLQEALEHMHWREPLRGPKRYVASNGLCYINELATRSIREYSGVERIVDPTDRDNLLYEMHYMAGVVNKD